LDIAACGAVEGVARRLSEHEATMSLPPDDLLELDSLLTDEQRAIRDTVRRFVNDKHKPIAAQHYRDGTFPDELVPQLAELGLIGAMYPDYGCAGMDAVSYGLVMKELSRADSGLRSWVSVQGTLAMYPIWKFGSDDQKERWLPALRDARAIGCFALSEPDAGSDPASMRTRADRVDGGWVLNGTKRWITNGTSADVAVVWARTTDEDKRIRAFLVERGAPGFSTEKIEHKQSFRASDTAELIFEDVPVSDDAVLPDARGLGAALDVLNNARYGIIWGVLGAAEECYLTALRFAQERVAFGEPIARKQLVQRKLAMMAAELSKAHLLAWRIAELKDAGRLKGPQVSLGKMNNVEMALDVARAARDILGANGIMDDYPVMRHMMNLETVFTYEGTHDVHLLVVGNAITGENAFR
jgi:glutaryl-CoA dehydrogenase